VTTALDTVPHAASKPVVFAGFSQGAAMAYRAACRGSRQAAGIISVGGDVPPELLADPSTAFPPVLMIRGRTDEWYTQEKFDEDARALRARGVRLQALLLEGGHEWHAPVIEAAARFLQEAAAAPPSPRL
jgi:predicted esterase